MAELLLKAFAAVFAAVVVLSGAAVSAQTHHVLGGDGGWGTALDVGSWLSGRVFRVGDKISFNCSGTDNNIVELESPEDFHSCDLSNPIKLYTDPISQIELKKEGARYFTSANPDNCKNGLKLHVPVESQEYEPHPHEPPFEPFTPHEPPVEPFPPYDPPQPVRPPPQPVRPPPSAAAYLNNLSLVMFVGLLICYVVV
ncbi:small blue copper protein Bcp1 [Striga asiatica]|uniref:Small blue copper protein Bcp1 n=1 Tax=Striga asiatica TaxID=4170 RepID=A0A5A7QII2_STRAF|nr:small blue copper protein Bcp1 [Striga asiatica]